mgnify:CR=1 FL=1
MKFINLDELERKVKETKRPTPQDVLNLIADMKTKL